MKIITAKTKIVRNIFLSVGVLFALGRLLGAGMNDPLLNFSNAPLVPAPAIITFDAPGAGTGPGQGTLVGVMDPTTGGTTITGFYLDAGDVFHGYLRAPNGTITIFDAPGSGTGPFQGTQPASIAAETITGFYVDA